MAKASTPKPRKKKRLTPKAQQAASSKAIMRAKYKALAIQFRLQEFSITQIAEAINEHYGKLPDGTPGPGVDELPAGFVHRTISRHLVHDLIVEAIKEMDDPLEKAELRAVYIGQFRSLLAAVMGPATQGSIAHVSTAQGLLRDIAKLLGLFDDPDDKGSGGGGITQIFVNGSLANV